MSTKPPQILGHGASEANDDEEIRDPRLEILESLSDGISHGAKLAASNPHR